MKKLKLIFAVTFIALLVGIFIFLNLPTKDQTTPAPYFDVPDEFVAVREYTEDERKEIGIYKYITPDVEPYAIGINQYGKPVFKDPNKAIAALYVDYSDAIEYLNRTNKNLTNSFGSNQGAIINTETDDPILRDHINFVMQFIVIFSNSFHE